MEALNKLALYIQNLERKTFQKYLMIFLLAVLSTAGLVVYYIHQKQSELIARINQLQILSNKAFKLIDSNKKMAQYEQEIKERLDKNKGFTLQSFFEQFYRQQNLIPEPDWNARRESLNDKFDEIVLQTVFKGLDTEKIVSVLGALNATEMVYIKDLEIRSEGSGKLTLNITLATKKDKSVLD